MPTGVALETLLPFAAISHCRASGESDSAAHTHLELTHGASGDGCPGRF